MNRSRALAVVVPLLLSACSVKLTNSESGDVVQNQCTADRDCNGGRCWFNVCVARGEGALPTLLLELTPPVTAPVAGIGGLRHLRMETGLSRSNEQHDLDLQSVSTIRGFFKSDCRYDVTLTPQEQSYGLPAVSYIGHTAAGARTGPCGSVMPAGSIQEFAIDVPSGTMDAPAVYDVYLRPRAPDPSSGSETTPCSDVPQLLRQWVKADPGVACNSLPLAMLQTLDVEIPWPAQPPPTAWKMDVLDPLSGQILSQGATALVPSEAGQNVYKASLKYSQPVGGESTKPLQELLRLTPPLAIDGPAGPVLLFSLEAATASSQSTASGTQKAVLPPIGTILPKVHVDGWVWEGEEGGETPVPSLVTFTATRLDGLASGIFGSFSRSVDVGQTGHLSVDLLPGDYRVRTVPNSTDSQGPRLSSGERTLTVPADGTPMIAGIGILLANTVTLRGKAVSALQAGIDRATVQLVPATVGVRDCGQPDGGVCDSEPLDVLAQSLAEDAFVPRTEATVTLDDGRFVLDGVDCGNCDVKPNAFFDLSVQPAEGSHTPWIVVPGLSVSTMLDVGTLRASLPIIQRGTVQFPNKGQEPTPVPGTRIRAFVVRDATGAPVGNPDGLPSCSSGTYSVASSPTGCIRSVLQVAAATAGPDGKYELALPSAIESLAQ